MSEPFVGQIQAFAFNFAPVGWQLCQGQLLSIQSNAALFSLLGTTFGGNGTTTFALPDLRGRAPNGQGAGPGLATYVMGQSAGTENITLNPTQMPAHNHNVNTNNSQGTSATPSNNLPAGVSFPRGQAPANKYAAASDGTTLLPSAVSNAGGSQSHSNLQPYLTINYSIATTGLFPSRS